MSEALSAVFTPVVLRKVLREACQAAGLASVPDAPASLSVFLEGALLTTLTRRLGVPLALELSGQIRESLLHVFGSEVSTVHSTGEVPISKARELVRSSGPAAGYLALVVTQASLVVFLLQDQLGDAVEVLPVSGEKELQDRLRRFCGRSLLVVIDRRHPCVGPSVAHLLRRELEPTSPVIWWGADEAEMVVVEAALSGGPRLVRTSAEARLADLGSVCLSAIA